MLPGDSSLIWSNLKEGLIVHLQGKPNTHTKFNRNSSEVASANTSSVVSHGHKDLFKCSFPWAQRFV